MLQLILLILGIVYAFRRPKIRKLTAQDFPEVDEARFLEWQQAELKSIGIFLLVVWGAVAEELIFFTGFSLAKLTESDVSTVQTVFTVAWFASLFVPAIYGSKARKLRKVAGIKLGFKYSKLGAWLFIIHLVLCAFASYLLFWLIPDERLRLSGLNVSYSLLTRLALSARMLPSFAWILIVNLFLLAVVLRGRGSDSRRQEWLWQVVLLVPGFVVTLLMFIGLVVGIVSAMNSIQ